MTLNGCLLKDLNNSTPLTKLCTKCGESKSLDHFSRNKSGLHGLKSYCKSCHNSSQRELARKRKLEDPVSWRNFRWEKHLKSAYGLTPQDYKDMLSKQKGVCLICGKAPEESRDGKLFVDHCHTSLENRGLLCYHCNTLLGLAKDNKSILERAILYLQGDLK